MRDPAIDGVARALADQGQQLALDTSGGEGGGGKLQLWGHEKGSSDNFTPPMSADELQKLLNAIRVMRLSPNNGIKLYGNIR